MRLFEIIQPITESREDVLINKYATDLGILIYGDRTNPYKLPKDFSGDLQTQYKELAQIAAKWIHKMFEMDPSKKGKYVQWAIIQYFKGNYKYEDLGNVFDDLAFFNENKPYFIQKDINQYTVDSLADAKDNILDSKEYQSNANASGKEVKRSIKQQATKILDTKNVLVVRPDTQEAACYYGANTRWCTASKHDNAFDMYTNDDHPMAYGETGPLYILIDKKTNEKFQLHFPTRQIMDEKDKEVSPMDFISEFPEVFEKFSKEFKDTYIYLKNDKELQTLSAAELKAEIGDFMNELDDHHSLSSQRTLIGKFGTIFKKVDGGILFDILKNIFNRAFSAGVGSRFHRDDPEEDTYLEILSAMSSGLRLNSTFPKEMANELDEYDTRIDDLITTKHNRHNPRNRW